MTFELSQSIVDVLCLTSERIDTSPSVKVTQVRLIVPI